METWQIRFAGIVQGVGFRPLVYQLVHQWGIKGEVSNDSAGLCIRLNGTHKQAETLRQQLLEAPPPRARISHSVIEPFPDQFFETFEIIESESDGSMRLFITPDFALCETCRQEFLQSQNRRYHYPFITCTQCGPRYSIIQDLPYDRPFTTMQSFEMCDPCSKEYLSPMDRRHFSQTNSCGACGISLTLIDKQQGEVAINNQEYLKKEVIRRWEKGEIIAIKGIGGYLLTCDAQQEAAIARLRERKHRPAKPFAVMYPSLEALEELQPSDAAKKELMGPESPIVLLPCSTSSLAVGIADGLSEIGVMIPYTPLYEWLLQDYQQAIVATSANISHAPIVYQDAQHALLQEMADAILDNDRPIAIPQDDSVVRFTPINQQRIVIRRSRGLAPTFFLKDLDLPTDLCLLACGADMKSAFAFLYQGNVYLSQYLGNLSHFDTEAVFRQVYQHIAHLLSCSPECVLHDQHPAYSSTQLAQQIAQELQVPVQAFFHHRTHAAAALLEHNLWQQPEPVLCVVWDGTGYGEDGQIWGGEWFLLRDHKLSRVGQLSYFPVLAGDKMAREPRLCALSILPEVESIREKFSVQELVIYDRMIERATKQSSSMGRLFDAVASVLGICDVQSYEGEAAMKLEALTLGYVNNHPDSLPVYPIEWKDGQISVNQLLHCVVEDHQGGKDPAYIAAVFHQSLVKIIHAFAQKMNLKHIACSGGVFQNALLVDLLIQQLGHTCKLYFHQQVSPNDENIALGQLALYLNQTNQL